MSPTVQQLKRYLKLDHNQYEELIVLIKGLLNSNSVTTLYGERGASFYQEVAFPQLQAYDQVRFGSLGEDELLRSYTKFLFSNTKKNVARQASRKKETPTDQSESSDEEPCSPNPALEATMDDRQLRQRSRYKLPSIAESKKKEQEYEDVTLHSLETYMVGKQGDRKTILKAWLHSYASRDDPQERELHEEDVSNGVIDEVSFDEWIKKVRKVLAINKIMFNEPWNIYIYSSREDRGKPILHNDCNFLAGIDKVLNQSSGSSFVKIDIEQVSLGSVKTVEAKKTGEKKRYTKRRRKRKSASFNHTCWNFKMP